MQILDTIIAWIGRVRDEERLDEIAAIQTKLTFLSEYYKGRQHPLYYREYYKKLRMRQGDIEKQCNGGTAGKVAAANGLNPTAQQPHIS